MPVRLVETNAGAEPSSASFLRTFEKKLEAAANGDQLLQLIQEAREFAKSSLLSSEDKELLKNLRKRIHTKKRSLLTQVSSEPISTRKPSVVDEKSVNNSAGTIRSVVVDQKSNSFLQGFCSYFSKIDGEQFVRRFFQILPTALGTIAISILLFLQSVDLYHSSRFKNPEIVALGGLAMIFGFAALYAIRGGILGLLCCLYMGGYETYFIASGTIADEANNKTSTTEILDGRSLRAEQVSLAKQEYEQIKKRFNDPDRKVYQNRWYKKNHLDPALAKYAALQNETENFSKRIASSARLDHTGWLKILYRLGLVFLCMMFVHRLFSRRQAGEDNMVQLG